jgi:hypothetical protein
MRTLVLVMGGLCAVLGAVFILLKDQVEGLLWFGIPVQLLGMAMVWMAFRKQRPNAAPPTPRQAAWILAALGLILLLQLAYFIWWSISNR